MDSINNIMGSYAEIANQIFHELNELRANPAYYAERLEGLRENYKANNSLHRPGDVPVLTREGVAALDDAIKVLRSASALPELKLSEGLRSAAQGHVNDTGKNSLIGHNGSDDSTFLQRLDSAGKWKGSVAEALDYGSISAFEIVANLLIDDGQPTRPHRQALLNKNYKQVGYGFGPHEEYKTTANVILATEFHDLDTFPTYYVPEGVITESFEAKNWLEGAVRLTCEVTTEAEGSKIVRRYVKHWELADGSSQTTTEVYEIGSN
jgi:hypothetical protein